MSTAPPPPACSLFGNGNLIFDEYFNNTNSDLLLPIASITKTIVGTLIGMLIQKQILTGPDQRLTDILPELAPLYKNSPRKN